MQEYKPIDTSIVKSEGLTRKMCPKAPQEKEQIARLSYSNVVGSLMYAMMCTRPDICYVVGMVSRYQSNPSQPH